MTAIAALMEVFTLNTRPITMRACDNGPNSLFACASYFILCSVHTWFASVTFIDCK